MSVNEKSLSEMMAEEAEKTCYTSGLKDFADILGNTGFTVRNCTLLYTQLQMHGVPGNKAFSELDLKSQKQWDALGRSVNVDAQRFEVWVPDQKYQRSAEKNRTPRFLQEDVFDVSETQGFEHSSVAKQEAIRLDPEKTCKLILSRMTYSSVVKVDELQECPIRFDPQSGILMFQETIPNQDVLPSLIHANIVCQVWKEEGIGKALQADALANYTEHIARLQLGLPGIRERLPDLSEASIKSNKALVKKAYSGSVSLLQKCRTDIQKENLQSVSGVARTARQIAEARDR